MGGGVIAVVDVSQLWEIDAKLVLIVEPESGLRGAKLDYGREFPVGDLVPLSDAVLQLVANGPGRAAPGVQLDTFHFAGLTGSSRPSAVLKVNELPSRFPATIVR